jgi:riboflavin biosynthesis pyrimidine reductase
MLAVVLSPTVAADPAASGLRDALAHLNVPGASEAVPSDVTWFVAAPQDAAAIDAARARGYRVIVLGSPEAPSYAALMERLSEAYTQAMLHLRFMIRGLWS